MPKSAKSNSYFLRAFFKISHFRYENLVKRGENIFHFCKHSHNDSFLLLKYAKISEKQFLFFASLFQNLSFSLLKSCKERRKHFFIFGSFFKIIHFRYNLKYIVIEKVVTYFTKKFSLSRPFIEWRLLIVGICVFFYYIRLLDTFNEYTFMIFSFMWFLLSNLLHFFRWTFWYFQCFWRKKHSFLYKYY